MAAAPDAPGARGGTRRASSVVAALAALAPRLVRLAHHDYPDRLLGGCRRPGRPLPRDDFRSGEEPPVEVRLQEALGVAARLEGEEATRALLGEEGRVGGAGERAVLREIEAPSRVDHEPVELGGERPQPPAACRRHL